jgi:hypothetical protein
MLARLAAVLMFGTGLAHACECRAPNFQEAQRHADIIFHGRITGFRDTGSGTQAVFAVERVWKGEVSRIFEMPAIKETTACAGFWPDWLKVGNDLIVYAFKVVQTGYYVTDICSRTGFAATSKDLAVLGAGRQPNSK